MTTKEFMIRACEVHGDKYNYLRVNYVNNRIKIIIRCPIHGCFLQIPKLHLKGSGCPMCAINKKITMGEFIKRSVEIHKGKYDYSKINYINSTTKVVIICKICGREFLQTPQGHLNGNNCIVCANKKSGATRTSSTKEFVERATMVHENKYDYSKVNYVKNDEKVIIICLKCGFEFLQTPNHHLQKRGCPQCRVRTISLKNSSTTKEFISKASKIHGNKYDYSKVNYVKNRTRVIIICKTCKREFLQQPNGHLSGYGCMSCGFNISGLKGRSTTEAFIEEAIRVHGDKYDYSKVNYIKSDEKVVIICKKCDVEFIQTPNNHLKGNKCPRCSKLISTPEQEFLKYCKIYNTPRNRQVRIGRYKVDGYKITTNTVYEFLGDYWHGNPKVFNPRDINKAVKRTYGEIYKKTFDRLQTLKNMGVFIRYIWEKDWKDYKNGKVSTPNIQEI